MIDAILRKIRVVDPILLEERAFPIYAAHLELPGSGKPCYMEDGGEVKKVYFYFQDSRTKKWRFISDDPQNTKRYLGVMAVAALNLYLATLIFRVFQATVLLSGFFFRIGEFIAKRRFSKERVLEKKRELALELAFIIKSLRLDLECSAAMIVSGVAANFYRDECQIHKMEVIFSEAEQRWNQGPGFDAQQSEESAWHAENAFMAVCVKALKNTPLDGQAIFQKIDMARKSSNKTFYLFQDAQPLSSAFFSRVKFVEPRQIHSDYSELLRAHKAQVERPYNHSLS